MPNSGAGEAGEGRSLEYRITRLDAPQHADAIALKALWDSQHSGDGWPPRAAFDLTALGRFMRSLVIGEPVDGGRDWTLRYVGPLIEERIGYPLQGRRMRQVWAPADAQVFIDNYNAAARGEFYMARGRMAGAASQAIEYEVLLLPMAGPDGQTWIIGGQFEI